MDKNAVVGGTTNGEDDRSRLARLARYSADELRDEPSKEREYFQAVKEGALKPNRTRAWQDRAYRDWIKGETGRPVRNKLSERLRRSEQRDWKRVWKDARQSGPERMPGVRMLAAGGGYGATQAQYLLATVRPSKVLRWVAATRRVFRGTTGTRRRIRARSVRVSRAGPDDGPPGEPEADRGRRVRVGAALEGARAFFAPGELSLERLLRLAGGDEAVAHQAFGQLPLAHTDPINEAILASADRRHVIEAGWS